MPSSNNSSRCLIIEGVKLQFTEDALAAIATLAMKAGTGARALRLILENLMRELMFEVPSDDTISEILIEKETVIEKKNPQIKRTDQKIA